MLPKRTRVCAKPQLQAHRHREITVRVPDSHRKPRNQGHIRAEQHALARFLAADQPTPLSNRSSSHQPKSNPLANSSAAHRPNPDPFASTSLVHRPEPTLLPTTPQTVRPKPAPLPATLQAIGPIPSPHQHPPEPSTRCGRTARRSSLLRLRHSLALGRTDRPRALAAMRATSSIFDSLMICWLQTVTTLTP